jgi:hypothetical protein
MIAADIAYQEIGVGDVAVVRGNADRKFIDQRGRI